MKKFFLVLSFFFCGIVLFLATVDLSPYLAPETVSDENIQIKRPAIAADSVPESLPIHRAQATKSLAPIEMASLKQVNEEVSTPAVTKKSVVPVSTAPVPALLPEPSKSPDSPEKDIAATSEQIPAAIEPPAPPEPLKRDPDCQTYTPGEYPFSILLETFDVKETAINAVVLYRKKSIESYWVKVDLGNKGIKYRLFSGAFRDRKHAELFAKRNNLENKPIKRTRFSALIGKSIDAKKIADLRTAAIQAETVPYLLCNGEGLHFLYVGAFYTTAGAKAQCEDLTKAGLDCSAQYRRVTGNN